jgi:hypothetical protein
MNENDWGQAKRSDEETNRYGQKNAKGTRYLWLVRVDSSRQSLPRHRVTAEYCSSLELKPPKTGAR